MGSPVSISYRRSAARPISSRAVSPGRRRCRVRNSSKEHDKTGAGNPAISAAPFDPRAMMVVEFPSQHVAEEAFFEQRIARPAPPRYPASLLQDNPELASKFDKLRSLYLSQNLRVKPAPDSGKLDAKAKKRIALRGDLL